MGAEARGGQQGRPGIWAGPRGISPRPLEEPVGVRGWPRGPDWPGGPLLLAPAREGREKTPRPRRPPRAPGGPQVGSGVRGRCGTRALRRGFPGPGASPQAEAWNAGGAAAASPPPTRGPAASFPPPAWRAAAATARAAGGARNGARLTASPGRGERESRGARRPQARGPQNGLRDHPSTRGAVSCGLSGPGPAEGPPPAPGSQRQPGKEGGRKKAAAISHPQSRPGSCPGLGLGPGPGPGPAGGSALNLKIKLVFGREERARPGAQAALGLQAGEMLRHGANMDAGLLSFFAQEAQAHPGAPKSRLRRARPPQSKGKETPGPEGEASSAFVPAFPKALQFLLPPRLRPRKARRTSAGGSVDAPRRWGDLSLASGAEGAKGSEEPSSSPPPHPSRSGCQT